MGCYLGPTPPFILTESTCIVLILMLSLPLIFLGGLGIIIFLLIWALVFAYFYIKEGNEVKKENKRKEQQKIRMQKEEERMKEYERKLPEYKRIIALAENENMTYNVELKIKEYEDLKQEDKAKEESAYRGPVEVEANEEEQLIRRLKFMFEPFNGADKWFDKEPKNAKQRKKRDVWLDKLKKHWNELIKNNPFLEMWHEDREFSGHNAKLTYAKHDWIELGEKEATEKWFDYPLILIEYFRRYSTLD